MPAILDLSRNTAIFRLEIASEAMTAIAVAGPRNDEYRTRWSSGSKHSKSLLNLVSGLDRLVAEGGQDNCFDAKRSLLESAERCPVSKTLRKASDIVSSLAASTEADGSS